MHVIRNADAPFDQRDPNISNLGIQQCNELGKVFGEPDSVELFVCSPLRRAIDTALTAFANPKKVKVIAHPDARETTDNPSCLEYDTGSSRSSLEQQYNNQFLDKVDFELVPEAWEHDVRNGNI